MSQSMQRRPEGASAVTTQVLDVLGQHTMFPWPLLKTQAERRGLDGASLDVEGLRLLLADIHAALIRFGSPEKASAAVAQLTEVIATLDRQKP